LHDVATVEGGDLHEHVGRLVTDLGLFAPMTPAMTSPRSSSAITSISSSSCRVVPSSRVILSPGCARRTTMPPRTLWASKAWMGWPVSSMT
jgi:hypothetical protein